MGKKIVFRAFTVCIVAILASCGPSQTELDQTATVQAADEFATLTAEAPTNTPKPTKTPLPSPTATPVPLDILSDSMDAFELIETYHFDMELDMTIQQEGLSMEIPMTLTGNIGSEDSMKALVSMTVMGVTAKTEMIRLDGTTYITDTETGLWGVTEEQVTPVDPSMFSDMDPTEIDNLSFMGEEMLDGTPVYHLTGTISAEEIGKPGGEMRVDYWIGVEEFLTRKITLEGEIDFLDPDILGEEVPSTIGLVVTMTLSDFGKFVVIEAPEISPAYQLVDSPFGPMAVYQSSLYPFSIQYPSDWIEQPATLGISALFSSDLGGSLTVAEEDVVAQGLGKLTLEQYGDMTVSYISTYVSDSEIISRRSLTTQAGIPAEVIAFTFSEGLFEARRFYALHEGQFAFNATYLAPKARFVELEPLITYSLGTVRIVGSDCLANFPIAGTIPAIAPIHSGQQILSIDKFNISLWPEFDRADMLAMYRIQLTPGTEVPAMVTIPIPASAGEPFAVAYLDKDNQLINANYKRVVQGDWALIEIEAESTILKLEYYAKLMQEDSWKGHEFIWPGGIRLGSFSYIIQWPEGSSDSAVSPPSDSQGVDPNGLILSGAELGPQAASSTFNIRLCYYK